MGVGALAVVSYWIYSIQDSKPFWGAPTYVGVAIILFGGALTIAYAFRSRDETKTSGPRLVQNQRSGRNSTNVQVGESFNTRPTSDDD
jgi:hypothetical protein